MAIFIDFEAGKETIEGLMYEMFNSANEMIRNNITGRCVEVVESYSWQYLKDYLVTCYSQMLEGMPNQLEQEFSNFVDGDGGFVHFAQNTLNSEEAVEYAKHVTDSLLEYPTTLSDNLSYLDEVNQINTENSRFDDEIVGEMLDQLFLEVINEAEQQKEEYVKSVEAAAEENEFVAPLISVPKILFGSIISWYNSIAATANDFIEGARQLIESANSRAVKYSETTAKAVNEKVQDVHFKVEN